MIDPKDLEAFNAQLAQLVGAKFEAAHLFIRGEKVARYVITLKKEIPSERKRRYELEITDCAWEIWHENKVIYSYFLDNTWETAQNILEKFKDSIVKSVQFDTGDLSLLVQLDNNIGLKLLHSKENSWNYHYQIAGVPTFYQVYNDTIGMGCVDGG